MIDAIRAAQLAGSPDIEPARGGVERAIRAAATCDVLLTVGTSGVVYPAAEIPRIAASSGATVIQVNPEHTPIDRICAINLRATAAQALVTAVWDTTESQYGGTNGASPVV